MWLKLFIIKLNKGKFTDVPWQKGAPLFCYNVPRQRKDSLSHTVEYYIYMFVASLRSINASIYFFVDVRQ
jgi:hypothetical protein